MKTKIALITLGIVFLSTVAIALTLITEREVLTCTDTDGGIDLTLQGVISGQRLTGGNYSHTDYCLNDSVIREYACGFKGNSTYTQQWEESRNCTCSGGACLFPDLTITSMTYSLQNNTNSTNVTAFVSTTVANIGELTAGNSVLKLTLLPGGEEDLLNAGILAPNQTNTTLVIYQNLPNNSSFNVTAIVDVFDVVGESNENNNVESILFET